MRSRSFVFYATRGIPLLTLTALTWVLPAGAQLLSHAQATEVSAPGEHQRVQVIVHFDAPPSPSARFERQNNRLIVDVPRAELKGDFPPMTPKQGVVAGVLTQSFATSGNRTVRVLVTLREAARYGVVPRGNDLVISLEPGAYGVIDETIRNAPAKPSKPEEVTRVDDIQFEHSGVEDRVVIRAFSPPTRVSSSVESTGTRIVLDGTSLPPQLARILDVGAYSGLVWKIATFADPDKADRVVLDIEHTPGTRHRLVREAGALVFEFYAVHDLPTSLTGIARDGGIARKIRTVSTEEMPLSVPRVEDGLAVEKPAIRETATVPEAAAGVAPALFGQARDRYTGRRIDLDLKDADIHNVLRLLADVGHVNIITADNVSGTVTIRMRNVPWDQALDVILQAKNLGVIRQANMLRVAPLAELEKEREMTIARLKQETQLAPIETRLIPVSYAHAGDISHRAKELLSERGSIAVDERTNVMIVRDVAGNLNQNRGTDSRAGYADPAGTDRSANCRSDQQLSAGRRHSMGR